MEGRDGKGKEGKWREGAEGRELGYLSRGHGVPIVTPWIHGLRPWERLTGWAGRPQVAILC